MLKGGRLPIDLAVLRFLNNTIATPALDYFFTYLCDFDIWRWPVGIVAVVLLWKGGPRGRWMVALTVLAASIIDPTIYRIIKPLAGRIRPCHDPSLVWVRVVDGCGGLFSFPSSHAANMFGLAVVISGFYKATRYYLYPLAALVAIGRVYQGVHYPSDVMAGAVYGAVIGLGLIYLTNRLAPEKIGKYLHSRKIKADS
jgi:undecaprenyl-diphosphatase